MKNCKMWKTLSLGITAMLMTTAPVWAAETNAADVVENQTMVVGGKEEIIPTAVLEKAMKSQKIKGGKSGLKQGKKGKKTVYYMHNRPSEDISDPRYKGPIKSTDESEVTEGAEGEQEKKRMTPKEKAEEEARKDAMLSAQEALAGSVQTNAVREVEPVVKPPAEVEAMAAPYYGKTITKIEIIGHIEIQGRWDYRPEIYYHLYFHFQYHSMCRNMVIRIEI